MNQACPDCFPQFLKINEYSIITMIYVQLVVVQQKRNLHNVQRTKPFHGKKMLDRNINNQQNSIKFGFYGDNNVFVFS